MSEHSYHKLYDRLVDEVKTLYYANQVRIHKGLWALIISTVLFLTIMFITNGSKASCRDDKRAGSRDGGRPHRYDTAQDGCRPQR